jgi:heat shock protein HtpX
MKRIALFLATNIAILLVLSIVLQLLGVEQILDEQGVGLNYTSLLIFAAVFGMGVETVNRLADGAGIGRPEVAIFDSPSPNAFATGARRDKALVAVSTGLLHNMNHHEVEAVVGHEVSHVANGDMITLTLIQGVVNTFVIFFSRIIGHTVDRVVFRTERGYGPAYWITTILAQVVLGILASTIVMAFSRRREFRADAGGARLSGRENMIGALEALQRGTPEPLPEQMQAFGISSGGKQGFARLFMSHPPLEERIDALRRMHVS